MTTELLYQCEECGAVTRTVPCPLCGYESFRTELRQERRSGPRQGVLVLDRDDEDE